MSLLKLSICKFYFRFCLLHFCSRLLCTFALNFIYILITLSYTAPSWQTLLQANLLCQYLSISSYSIWFISHLTEVHLNNYSFWKLPYGCTWQHLTGRWVCLSCYFPHSCRCWWVVSVNFGGDGDSLHLFTCLLLLLLSCLWIFTAWKCICCPLFNELSLFSLILHMLLSARSYLQFIYASIHKFIH